MCGKTTLRLEPKGNPPAVVVGSTMGELVREQMISKFQPFKYRKYVGVIVHYFNCLRCTVDRMTCRNYMIRHMDAYETTCRAALLKSGCSINACRTPQTIKIIGPSPSGKAQDFDSCIRWFESSWLSLSYYLTLNKIHGRPCK